MPIVVVCPNCHARFEVSEKFAGKQGPCPKCKGVIKIPELGEEVKIHAPEDFAAGGKDAKGRPVLKPIERTETKVTPVLLVGVLVAVVLAFAVAFILRTSDLKSSPLVLGLGAVVLAPPLVIAGYSFLRNQELEPYRGGELFVRAAICSVVYASLWGAMWAIKHFLFGTDGPLETFNIAVLAAPALIIGTLTAFATLDLDFGSGFFHYVLYLAVCVLLRLVMKLPPL